MYSELTTGTFVFIIDYTFKVYVCHSLLPAEGAPGLSKILTRPVSSFSPIFMQAPFQISKGKIIRHLSVAWYAHFKF